MIDIGGLALHVDCGGQGTPVIVLEAGGGDDGSAWAQVVPVLRQASTTCAYDRAGTGLSPAASPPHTMPQMVSELHVLLQQVAPGADLLLVGHSLGGLLVRLYENEHPQRVRGMVLLDPTTEEQDNRMWSLLPQEQVANFRQGMDRSSEGLDYASFLQGMALLRSVDRSLGNLPLVVMTAAFAAGRPPPPVPVRRAVTEQRMARVWHQLHVEVAARSSNSVHVVLEKTGHDIPRESPQHVIAAVQEVLASLREQRKVAAQNILAERVELEPSGAPPIGSVPAK